MWRGGVARYGRRGLGGPIRSQTCRNPDLLRQAVVVVEGVVVAGCVGVVAACVVWRVWCGVVWAGMG